MPAITEDAALIRTALAYVNALHRELTQENGAATLGTQNQVVDFILGDPELRAAVAEWGRTAKTEEATTAPLHRLPIDDAYRRIRAYLKRAMPQPVFAPPAKPGA
jgi:hypothetical protein